jgi:very-short-patch-repair endonuclease
MCNEKLSSAVHLGHHVHKAHNLTGPDYALQYVFKGTPPTCKCGCGKPVLILKCPPYKREYIFGHWPTPNLKDYLTPKIRKKMSQKAIERVMRNKLSFNISSKSSSEFLDKLEQLFGVKIQREFQINSKFYDGKWKRHIFEVDGAYWHKNGNGRDKYKTRLARRHGFRVHRFVVNRVGEIQEKLDKYKNKLDVIFNRTK